MFGKAPARRATWARAPAAALAPTSGLDLLDALSWAALATVPGERLLVRFALPLIAALQPRDVPTRRVVRRLGSRRAKPGRSRGRRHETPGLAAARGRAARTDRCARRHRGRGRAGCLRRPRCLTAA